MFCLIDIIRVPNIYKIIIEIIRWQRSAASPANKQNDVCLKQYNYNFLVENCFCIKAVYY